LNIEYPTGRRLDKHVIWRIVAVGDPLHQDEIACGRKLATDNKLRDDVDNSRRLLARGWIYPVIVVLMKQTKSVLIAKCVKVKK
jgi:hypothetical protein